MGIMKQSIRSKQGSVLMATVGIALVGATVIGGYLTMVNSEYKLAQRTLQLQSAMNLAEAGLEEAMDSINTTTWTGWAAVGANGYFKEINSIAFSDTDRISDSFYANLWDVTVPSGTVDGVSYVTDFTTLAAGTIGGTGTTSNPEVYHISSFSMAASDQLNIIGPVVIIVDGTFSVNGNAGINITGVDASLEMYAAGDVAISGNGLLNDGLDPEDFKLWGTAPSGGSQAITVTGNGNTAGVFYAPNADLTLKGNGGMSGAAVGKNIDMVGNAEFHYDINLKGFETLGSYTVSRWRELRGASERYDFSDSAAVAAAISPL